jgi:hypothetical protein
MADDKGHSGARKGRPACAIEVWILTRVAAPLFNTQHKRR